MSFSITDLSTESCADVRRLSISTATFVSQMQETVTATEVVIDHEQGTIAAELTTQLRAIRDGVKLASRTLNKGDVYTTRGVVIYGLKGGRIVSIRGA